MAPTNRRTTTKGAHKGKDRRKGERRKDAAVLPGTAKMVWGKKVADLADQTGYTSSYLGHCRLANREPSLHTVNAIALATGKPLATVMAEFWPKRPATIKAHLSQMKAGRGKRTGGMTFKAKGKAKKGTAARKAKGKGARAGRKAAPAKRAAKRAAKRSTKRATSLDLITAAE